MIIEFDPAKDASNIVKHGISLSAAAEMDIEGSIVSEDRRHNYGERRWLALGLIAGRSHILVFTMRENVLRAISLRAANQKEREYYAKVKT